MLWVGLSLTDFPLGIRPGLFSLCSLKLSGTYRNRKNCIYSSIVFFLFYFFEVLLTILKNGFRNRAAFVSLQFVGFQPSFQVLGAALPKYGESSV